MRSAKPSILVLISHSIKDKAIAEALIELLRSALGLLPNQIRCTSVDGYRLPAGVNTDDQLRAEIKSVGVLIGLLTPHSITSTYVLFELGARWGAELFMIPLLAGITPERMQGPQRVLNAVSCETEAQLIQLVEDIGRQLNLEVQSAASYLKHARIVKSLAESISAISDAGVREETNPSGPHNYFYQNDASAKMRPMDEDQSGWPDVILECQWPSLVHESKIPGSHTVRKRPWLLRHGGPGAVYNVRVHDIDFGEYKASFPFPVRTLTDTASVHPVICQKSDGLVTSALDLESLIHNPPSGCDVEQYAVKTDGNEGEEIPLEGFILEVEIPVTVSYDAKNGNQFKIRYLLHYDTYMEMGEMIRTGRIEKVAPK